MVADCIKDTNSDEESEGDDVYDPTLLVCYIMSSNIIILLVKASLYLKFFISLERITDAHRRWHCYKQRNVRINGKRSSRT